MAGLQESCCSQALGAMAAPAQIAVASPMQASPRKMGFRMAASKKNSGTLFAQLQELHSSSNARDWQHLERCLQAPGAFELSSSSTVGVPGAGRNGDEAARPVRVAYQGSAGAYTHAVVGEAFGGAAEAIPCREFEAVFCAVQSWLADRALLPIQNSLDGSIHRNYDLLLRHRLHIVGELPWQVQHCLLARPGSSKAQLRRVIGHPQALSHCQHTLASLGISAESFQPTQDTTSAALQLASSCSEDTAVIASSKAAHVFGLHILAHGIQDDPQNITRFLQLARDPLPCTPSLAGLPCKTTVAFSLRNGPSDLCKAMSAFALRDIKVTNLESRPAAPQQQQADETLAAGQFKYVFVVDIEASSASARAQRALKQVEEISCFYRVLGSYGVQQQQHLNCGGTRLHSSIKL